MSEILSTAFTNEQLERLYSLPPEHEIEWKPAGKGGGDVPYIDGEYVLRTAQEIFGPGNFAYQILGSVETIATGVTNSNKAEIFLVSAQVQVQIRTALGDWINFCDIGDCESQGTGAPAMSMARKGAVTDGIKRCLRSWPAFGSTLYTREGRREFADTRKLPGSGHNPKQVSGFKTAPKQLATAPDKITTEQLDTINRLAISRSIDAGKLESRCRELFGCAPGELTSGKARQLIEKLEAIPAKVEKAG